MGCLTLRNLSIEALNESSYLPQWAKVAWLLLATAGPRTNLLAPYREDLEAGVPSVMAELRRRSIDSLHYLACDPAHPAQRLWDKIWRAQREALLELGQAFELARVDFLVFKGAEFLERWYGSHALGCMSDCDLLLRRTDMVRAKQILFGLGYRPSVFVPEQGTLVDSDVVQIAELESRHYQLAPFCRLQPLDLLPDELDFATEVARHPLWVTNKVPVLVLEFDIHHAVATDLESGDFFDRAIPSAFPIGRSLSHADHLWFTLSRYYTEVSIHGKPTLRDLAYVAPLLLSNAIEWEVVIAATRSYEIRPALYYPIRFLDFLLDNPVPAEALEELNPIRGSRLRDFGWQIGKLFDFVEPPPWQAKRGPT